MQHKRPLWLALAALAGAGCSVIFPTGDYVDPLAQSAGDAGTVDPASTCGRAMAVPEGYAATQLVFEDSFCGAVLDTKKWSPSIPGFSAGDRLKAPLSGVNPGGIEDEYFDPSQVAVDNGLLLNAEPDSTVSGYTAKSGVIASAQTMGSLAGTAKNRLYIHLRAKSTSKNGMWAKAYVGPVGGDSAVLVTLMATGFTGLSQGTTLDTFQTTVADSSQYVSAGTDLTTAVTDYGVEIVWGESVTWYWNAVDGQPKQVRSVKAASGASIPTSGDGETLVIALAVINGQKGSSDWHTVWNGEPDAFEIAAVQVYAQ